MFKSKSDEKKDNYLKCILCNVKLPLCSENEHKCIRQSSNIKISAPHYYIQRLTSHYDDLSSEKQ